MRPGEANFRAKDKMHALREALLQFSNCGHVPCIGERVPPIDKEPHS